MTFSLSIVVAATDVAPVSADVAAVGVAVAVGWVNPSPSRKSDCPLRSLRCGSVSVSDGQQQQQQSAAAAATATPATATTFGIPRFLSA